MAAARLAYLLLIVCTLQLSSCRTQRPGADARAEVERLVQLTVPPNGSLVQGPEVRTRPASIEADWEISSLQSSEEYRAWLLKQLGPEYRSNATTSRLLMRRALEADAYELEVTWPASSGALRLHFHFSARPD